MNKRLFISLEDINTMCSKSEVGNAHNEKSSRDSSDDIHNESEQKNSKWSNFKAKAQSIWSRAKNIASEIVTGLVIIKSLLKVSAGVLKEFARFMQARKAFA